MQVSFEKVSGRGPAAVVRLSAADAAHLPGTPPRVAGRHIVLAYDAQIGDTEIKVPVSKICVLALGQRDEAILVFDDPRTATPTEKQVFEVRSASSPVTSSNADALFVGEASKVDRELGRLARLLLSRIRDTHKGQLQQTEKNPRKFVEAPDNYWAVEVQNRARAIKFIIRSDESRLRRSGIGYSSERPPSYFYVKVESDGDIDTALRFLSLADHKL